MLQSGTTFVTPTAFGVLVGKPATCVPAALLLLSPLILGSSNSAQAVTSKDPTPIAQLLAQARETQAEVVEQVNQENQAYADRKERRRKYCQDHWDDMGKYVSSSYGAWMSSCLGKWENAPHDKKELELLERYYAGITAQYLLNVQRELGLDFMLWWAKSGSMRESPIRRRSGATIVLTPIQQLEESTNEYREALRQQKEAEAKARLPATPVIPDVEFTVERVQISGGRSGMPIPSSSAFFMPIGFVDYLHQISNVENRPLSVPLGATSEFPGGVEVAIETPRSVYQQALLYDDSVNDTRFTDSTSYVTAVLNGTMYLSPAEQQQIAGFADIVHTGPVGTSSEIPPQFVSSVEALLVDPTEEVQTYTRQFQQFYFHGILSDRNFISDEYLGETGGSLNNRLDWDATLGITTELIAEQGMVRSPVWEGERSRLIDRIRASYDPKGPPILLHGHSAGGIMAAEVAEGLTANGISVAGVITYGSPADRLSPNEVESASRVPTLHIVSNADEVMLIDSFPRATHFLENWIEPELSEPNGNHRVIRLSEPEDDWLIEGQSDHVMSDYESLPGLRGGVQEFARMLLPPSAEASVSGINSSSPTWGLGPIGPPRISGIAGGLVSTGKAAAIAPADVREGDVVQIWRRTASGELQSGAGFVSEVNHSLGGHYARLETVNPADGRVVQTRGSINLEFPMTFVVRINQSALLTSGVNVQGLRKAPGTLPWTVLPNSK